MLWTSGQSSPKFGLYVLFGFAFCNPSRRVSISAFVHSLWTNEKVKYRQCLCFARQTYSEEVLEINTSRYSLKIFILTTYSTLKNISCVYIHRHIHTFIEPWQVTRWSTSIHSCSHAFWRRQWHPTPVLLPGKSYGWRSLVGCSPWGR